MASQLGGALTPLLVVPIQAHYGWRATFYVFGLVGVAWSAAWYWWFRDSPAEKPGVSVAELEETRGLMTTSRHGIPWGFAFRSGNVWAVMVVAFCYVYTFYFFLSWFHTYLVKARGFSEKDLLLTSLPFLVSACANFGGGIASTAAVRWLGLASGRRFTGIVGLGASTICIVAAMFTHQGLLTLILLSLVLSGITFQQPAVFALCLDIGGESAGAMVGVMNTAAQLGSFVSSVMFGFLVDRYGNYDVPFIPMAALLFIGTALWLKIDATKSLRPSLPADVLVAVAP